MDRALPEQLLAPGTPLFEYWGHEACWLPMELYPFFEFRRREFRSHPWWGDLVGKHPEIADTVLRRIREEGPLKTGAFEDGSRRGKGFWELGITKRVADALWSSGDLAIRERRNFQRTYDLAERVIPAELRERTIDEEDSLAALLLRALEGHGWATTGTLARTWRLRNRRTKLDRALAALVERGDIAACALPAGTRRIAGWVRPADLEFAATLAKLRPRRDRGVLLSPFDPLLWDRERVALLFDFEAVLEIFKPAPQRKYGYYCLPVLAGDRLVARFDLKAERIQGRLCVLRARFEDSFGARSASSDDGEAAHSALHRWARTLHLAPVGWSARDRRKAPRHERTRGA
jgi:uncharacterized protein YcaQ